MATKKFKKLPKDSQRAAFAQMDEDGTRQGRSGKSGGGGVAVKTLKPSEKKLPHLKSADQKAMFERSVKRYGSSSPLDKSKMEQQIINNEISAEQTLRSKDNSYFTLSSKSRAKEYLGAARAFRIKNRKK